MKFLNKWFAWMLAVVLASTIAAVPTFAQTTQQQHVVSLGELQQAAGSQAALREADEAAVRHLLSSEAGQRALKSANVDYQRVDRAISQLSDQELARLAARSRRAQSDFAAGFISAKTLAYIILATVVIVVIIVLV